MDEALQLVAVVQVVHGPSNILHGQGEEGSIRETTAWDVPVFPHLRASVAQEFVVVRVVNRAHHLLPGVPVPGRVAGGAEHLRAAGDFADGNVAVGAGFALFRNQFRRLHILGLAHVGLVLGLVLHLVAAGAGLEATDPTLPLHVEEALALGSGALPHELLLLGNFFVRQLLYGIPLPLQPVDFPTNNVHEVEDLDARGFRNSNFVQLQLQVVQPGPKFLQLLTHCPIVDDPLDIGLGSWHEALLPLKEQVLAQHLQLRVHEGLAEAGGHEIVRPGLVAVHAGRIHVGIHDELGTAGLTGPKAAEVAGNWGACGLVVPLNADGALGVHGCFDVVGCWFFV